MTGEGEGMMRISRGDGLGVQGVVNCPFLEASN